MAYDPEKINFFAETDARGQRTRFGIKAKDRPRHVYVIGKTGMGKSTMLENMAIQDIQNGEGVAFIDPHGYSAEKLLDYVPEERVEDVLYFAPFDMENPVAFNIMEDVGADKRHLVVSGLMSVFAKIWVDAWSARMEYILQNTLLALLEYPDSTLLGVNKMLSDKKYREKVVANITDPGVKSFWVDEFAKYTDRFAAEATPAIQNKIGQFTSNPLIRNIIGQPHSSFDIRKIIDERKILVMNLSKGLVGESNANLLGSMLTTRIYLAAMSRANLSVAEMQEAPNFYFYVDEFQSFANSTFANILSESRKYKLNLTIAHQYIEQMEEEVKNAVFGNVGTIVTFRVGPFDAEVLETIFAPKFTATDIVNLSSAQVYLTLMIDGIGSQPFSATTLPPIEPPSVSYKDMVIAASRRSYASARQPVEAEVERFHGPDAEEVGESTQRRERHVRERKETGGDGKRQANPRNEKPEGQSGHARKRGQDERRGRPGGQNDRTGRNGKNERGGSQQKKEKSLEELRSVLKDLTNDGQEVKDKKQALPEKTEEQKPEHKNELKGALRGALGKASNEEKIRDEKETETRTPKSAPNPEPEAAPVPEHEPAGAPEAPAPEEAPQKKNEQGENNVSPKELERMMRITTSDRSPFRPS